MNSHQNSTLGPRLRARRLINDVTLKELAGATGTSLAQLSELECGKRKAAPETARRIDAFLSARERSTPPAQYDAFIEALARILCDDYLHRRRKRNEKEEPR